MLTTLLRMLFRLLSWLPLTGLPWLYSFALIARIEHGRFITPDVRIPMYEGWDIMYQGVRFFPGAILMGLPLRLLPFCFHWAKAIKTRFRVIVFFLGWALILIQVRWDPFKIVYWVMD